MIYYTKHSSAGIGYSMDVDPINAQRADLTHALTGDKKVGYTEHDPAGIGYSMDKDSIFKEPT